MIGEDSGESCNDDAHEHQNEESAVVTRLLFLPRFPQWNDSTLIQLFGLTKPIFAALERTGYDVTQLSEHHGKLVAQTLPKTY